jgi:hypothetical protein
VDPSGRSRRDRDDSTRLSYVGRGSQHRSDEQRTRLADIAERTPVTLTLKQGVAITTTIA